MGLCSEAISSINSWLGISLIHHPSRRGAIRSRNHGSRTKKSPHPIQWKLQSNLLTLHPQRSRRIKFIDPITGEGNKTCFPRSTTKEAADPSPSYCIVPASEASHLWISKQRKDVLTIGSPGPGGPNHGMRSLVSSNDREPGSLSLSLSLYPSMATRTHGRSPTAAINLYLDPDP